MVQELNVGLGGFCFLDEVSNLLHTRVLVPSGLLDAERLFVGFPIANFGILIHRNCKSLDIFVLLTKASANDIWKPPTPMGPIASKVSSNWI